MPALLPPQAYESVYDVVVASPEGDGGVHHTPQQLSVVLGVQ